MQKLLLFLIVFFGIFIFFIFKVPELSQNVAKNFGFEGFVINTKGFIDNIITKLPSREETYSGAVDVKEKVTQGLDYTKDKVDTIREYISGTQDTIDTIKDGYGEVKVFLSGASDTIDDAKKVVDDIKELTGSGIAQ